MKNLTIADEELEAAAMANQNVFSQRVKSAIRATVETAGITLPGLAAAMGVDVTGLSKILDGSRHATQRTLGRLAAAIDVPQEEILAGTWRPE